MATVFVDVLKEMKQVVFTANIADYLYISIIFVARKILFIYIVCVWFTYSSFMTKIGLGLKLGLWLNLR